MSAEFSLPIRVYIEDTDAGGIVYYVNYLKYLERCRTEFMRALGMDRAAVPDEGWMFVVSSLALTYRQPARLDDQLEATAEVVAVKGATIRFAQSVKREGSCMVEGDVTIACVDRASGKPRRLSPELKQQLEARMQNKETTT
ncbi:MAG: tol-pal system-associated acyl-CoA thioesterase [Halieaceae bacterium]